MTKAQIISNSKILGGKPIISGTRISVELVMNFLGAGMSVEDILKEYTELRKSEVLAAIDYATNLVAKSKISRSNYKSDFSVTLHEITR